MGDRRPAGHLSNLDKVLFPGAVGFTKRDLIRYYVTIAPMMLPYLRDRALNLWRWPDGVTGTRFWQKQIPSYAPDWIERWDYPEAGSSEVHTYIVADQRRHDGLAGQPRHDRHASLDLAHRRLSQPDLRADRHRPRRRRRHWTRW